MIRNMLLSALLLGIFAVVSTGLVAVTHRNTAPLIAESEKAALVETLHSVIPAARHDNDIYEDRIEVRDRELLGTSRPVVVYRARLQGEPVAAVLNPVAPDGYSGDINLLVAVNYDGTLAGVRVISHKETPGLGDRIEVERSDWITRFDGRSLRNPEPAQWNVKKDGGIFDQFTGATITPRAVVKEVANTLRYFETHREEIFQESHAADSGETNEEEDHE